MKLRATHGGRLSERAQLNVDHGCEPVGARPSGCFIVRKPIRDGLVSAVRTLKRHEDRAPSRSAGQRASILIIAMWVALGLVGIALYFAHSKTLELKAAGNRTAGLESEQAIEGAARYVSYVLANYATNGNVPDLSLYNSQAVPVGDAHFWMIGRDNSGDVPVEPVFGLVDEASKINLNSADTNTLSNLPNITSDFV